MLQGASKQGVLSASARTCQPIAVAPSLVSSCTGTCFVCGGGHRSPSLKSGALVRSHVPSLRRKSDCVDSRDSATFFDRLRL